MGDGVFPQIGLQGVALGQNGVNVVAHALLLLHLDPQEGQDIGAVQELFAVLGLLDQGLGLLAVVGVRLGLAGVGAGEQQGLHLLLAGGDIISLF